VSRPPAALLVAAVVVCAGCPRRGSDAAATVARVEYARRSFRSSLAGCADPASGVSTACVQIDIDYVELTRASAPLVEAVAAFLAATALRPVADAAPAESVEDLRDDLYERYRARQREVPGYRTPWVVERTITVACNTDRVQALTAVLRASAGDGDASERIEYRTFDNLTGEAVRLDDVVVAELRADFEDAVRVRLDTAGTGEVGRGSLFERAPTSARGVGWVDPEAILVCPETITVQWRDDGATTTVELPRDAVQAFLRSDAP